MMTIIRQTKGALRRGMSVVLAGLGLVWLTLPALALDNANDRCTGGTITASGENLPGEGMAKAFDNDTSTKWLTHTGAGWIAYQFGNGWRYAITNYTITSANDSLTYHRDPKDWTLDGSDDGVTWTTVDARAGMPAWPSAYLTLSFGVTNPVNTKTYAQYRLNVTATQPGNDGNLQLGEIEMFGSGGQGALVDNGVGATNVTDVAACLTGWLTSTGGSPVTAYVYWSTNDSGTSVSSWLATGSGASFAATGLGALSQPVTGLAAGKTYYYRFAASNDAGLAWAPQSASFPATLPPFGAWTRRAKITFSGYARSEALLNFPALVVLSTNIDAFSYGDFQSGTNDDLRFTDASEVRSLNYEIDGWNTNGASYVWVQVPRLASSNDYIWAYWGRGGQSAAACTTNGSTWSNGFLGVWHFGLTNGAPDLRDSSPNRNNGTNGPGASASTSAGGSVGTGEGFSGSQYLTVPSANRFLPSDTNITVSAWAKPTSIGSGGGANRYLNLPRGSGVSALFVSFQNNNKVGLSRYTGSGSVACSSESAATVPTGVWQHYAWTYGQTAGAVLCINGRPDVSTTTTGSAAPGNTDPSVVGASAAMNASFYTGVLDELRVSSVVRSTNWVWAEYMNTATNGAFAGSFNTYGGVALAGGAPEPPSVATLPPAAIGLNSADVVGQLSSTGTSATAVYVFYGETDGSLAGNWASTDLVAAAGAAPATFTNTLGLSTDRGYYYQYGATNDVGWRYGEVRSFLTAPVTITKDADASEVGLAAGTFTVHRASSATNVATTVAYAVTGGAASNGVDYAALSGSVALPLGVADASIPVTPLFDRLAEPAETVQLTLLSGLYPLGSPSNASMNIVDNTNVTGGLNLIWDNTAGNWYWDQTSLNWHRSGDPAGSTFFLDGDSVTIQSPAGTTMSLLNQTRTVGGITFADGGSDFTVGSGTLNLGAGGIVNDIQYRSATFNVNVALTTNVTVEHLTPAARAVTFNGWVDTAGYRLTCNGGGQGHTYNGSIKGAGSVLAQNGTIKFMASNALSGAVTADNTGIALLGGSAGSFLNASNVVVASGGTLTLGDGTSIADDGVTTFGRIANTQRFPLSGASLNLVGGAVTERVSNVTFRGSRSWLNAQSATFIPSVLARDDESRPVAVVMSANYNLGNGSYIKPGDAGAALTLIGGNGSRTTNKKIVPYFQTRTQNTYESNPNTFDTYDAVNGLVQLNPATEFVLGTSPTDFPAVDPDGNDNVRLLYSSIAPTNLAATVSLAGDTVVNSLMFDSDYPASGSYSKDVTLTGPAGSTLTVKSGAIMGTPSGAQGGNHHAFITVPTLAFGGAEGVVNMYGRDYAYMTISSALSGTNGLTLFHGGWGSSDLHITGSNSALTGQITIGSGQINIQTSPWVLGSGSNDLFLTGTLSDDVPVTGGRSVTVKSLKGYGTLVKNNNNPSFNVGGDGTGGAANTLTLTNNGTINPGQSDQAGTLTLGSFSSVKLMGGIVQLDLFSATSADQLALSGTPALTLNGVSLKPNLGYVPTVGDTFLAVSVAGSTAITGKFVEQDTVKASYGGKSATFNILYNSSLAGGDGNDIVLQCASVSSGNGTVFRIQ